MARPPKLNWETARGKWRVVYLGKKYRFDGGTGKSDRDARKRAESEWRALKARLDVEAEEAKPHRQEYRNVIAEWTSVLTWAMDHGDGKTAAVARDKIKVLEERLDQRTPPRLGWSDRFFADPAPIGDVSQRKHAEPIYNSMHSDDDSHLGVLVIPQSPQVGDPAPVPSEWVESMIWRDRLRSQDRRLEETDCDDTFAANVDKFLRQKRTEVAAGQLSAARAESLRIYLDIVMDFTGRTTSVQGINGATLTSFRNHLLSQIAANEKSDFYARDVFAAFKLFVKWLANSQDKLESLPRNIDDRGMSISVAERKAKTLSNEQIKILLKEATQRTKLYLLLGFNCAMTQLDMADLHPDEVDWKTGIITRKRSKTDDCENVPEVSWNLWPQTIDLLKKERSTDPDRVLLTRDGRPLWTDGLVDAKYNKTDPVRLAIRRLATKTKIKFTVKTMKKTSASLLRGHKDYKGLESLFLDHAPKSVAHRFYTAIPQQLLDEAIAWLGRELGITVEGHDAN